VTFEVNIVTPFKGVTLEVGGAVETYWKSMAVTIPGAPSQPALRLPKSSRSTDSAGTSPSIQSVVASAGNSLTISSLKDNYIYVVVQVTRDFHPVIFADWLLPESGFDLGVADVTLRQFESLAVRLRKDLDITDDSTDWRRVTAESMVSLARLMTVCHRVQHRLHNSNC
jgi:CDK inhibitor PHO81